MRHTKVDKPADQGEVLSYSEPEVYMRRANDVKERVLTRGGLTDDNPVDWRSKACCEKYPRLSIVAAHSSLTMDGWGRLSAEAIEPEVSFPGRAEQS